MSCQIMFFFLLRAKQITNVNPSTTMFTSFSQQSQSIRKRVVIPNQKCSDSCIYEQSINQKICFFYFEILDSTRFESEFLYFNYIIYHVFN